MIKRLVYNKKAFKILDSFTIKQSNAEVTFNDITIDFTGYSLLDIPFKYQELKIIQAETEEEILNENGEVVFTGFLDDIDLSEMKIRKEEQRELTLTVLSPLAMSTKRYVSLIGTYSKEEAIRRVLQPLLDDGFKIVEFNIPTGQITTNFVIESVENCMNDMCFKAGVFWFIDENKNIYINSIDYLFGLEIKKTIAPDVITKGLSKIQPKIENIDYANVINFKNVRLFYSTRSLHDDDVAEDGEFPLLNLPKKINKGDTIQFNNPVVLDEKTLRTIEKEYTDISSGISLTGIHISVEKDDSFAYADIGIETNNLSDDFGKYVKRGNCSFNDDVGEEAQIVLQRDSFFKNLITGFKWNGVDGATITSISSISALRYTTMRFMYSAEINNLKGIISKSGIIEKCVDYQEKWTTTTQLIDYARSLMTSNTKTINQVDLTFDETPNLRIGDIVEIHEPDFYIDGKFAVKEISYKYINDENEEWNIKLKNSDLNSTYIDLFRPAQKQENESKTDTVVLSEYVEETVYEKHEIGEKETLTGEVIVVKDNDGLITIEKINGAHSQKTTEGRNVFKIKDYTKLVTGLNQDATIVKTSDSITVTTANKLHSGFYINKSRMAEYTKDADTTKKYVISADIEISDSCLFRFGWEHNNTYQQVQKGKFRAKCNANTITQSFVCYTSNAEVTIKVTNLMVSLSEDSTFEEFTDGHSPNTNYQQEVETVGNNINILPGKEHWEQGSVDNKTGEPFSSTTRIRNKGFIGVEPKTNYFASLQNDDYAFVNIILYDNKGTYIKDYYSINNTIKGAKALLIAIPENCYNIKAILRNADDTSNITVDEYPQIRAKFEKGDIQTPYSAYNQGSIEVIKKNSNIATISNLGTAWEYIADGAIKNKARNIGTELTKFSIKKGQTIKINLMLISQPTVDSTFSILVNNTTLPGNPLNLGDLSKFPLNQILTRTYTATEDTEIRYRLYGNANSDIFEFKFWVNFDETLEYEKAEKEKYIIPVQQEMLDGDYIDSTEHHTWEKAILKGDEGWAASTNSKGLLYFNTNHFVNSAQSLSPVISNMFQNKPLWTLTENEDIVKFSDYSTPIFYCMLSDTSIDTVNKFTAWLKSKYDEGNPVIIYYKLATPIELELTDEQKAISKYLQPYDNGTTILVTDKLATITASYTKKGENDEN